MFKSFSDDKGFTLIELLVVILIIAILVAVALPNFLGQQDKANESSDVQRLTVAYKSAKAYVTTADAQGVYALADGTLAPAAADSIEIAKGIAASEKWTQGTAPADNTLIVSGGNTITVLVATAAGTSAGQTYVAGDLVLSATSKSGKACSLVSTPNGGLKPARCA